MDDHYYTTTQESAEYLNSFDYSNVLPDAFNLDPNAYASLPDQQTPGSSSDLAQSWYLSSNEQQSFQQIPQHYPTYQFPQDQNTTSLPVDWTSTSPPLIYEHLDTNVSAAINIQNNYVNYPVFSEPQEYSIPAEETGLYPEPRRASTFRSRISYEARAILDRWFDEHRSDPYLEKPEAEELSQETGLTVRQVRTYFANARARKLPPTPVTDGSGDTCSPAQVERGSTDQEQSRRGSYRQQRWDGAEAEGCTSHGQQRSPMERFLHSSPESEGVPEDALKSAAASFNQNRRPSVASSVKSNKRMRRSWRLEPYSDAGFSSRRGSDSHSHTSDESTTNRGPRRGRKRQPDNFRLPLTKAIIRSPPDQKKIYQCTFCATDFSHKYDWRRHEESVHFPQQEWICMPENTATIQTPAGILTCAFCGLEDPTPAHLDSHNCGGCLSTPRSHRVFTRKDKLLQHIGQVHKQNVAPRYLASWSRPVERDVHFWCGICGLRLSSWQERVDHISAHFSNGQGMQFWRGEPGNIQPASNAAPAPAHSRDASLSLSSSSPPPSGYPSAVASEPQNTTPLVCTSCGEPFPSHTLLLFHERILHNVYRAEPLMSPALLMPPSAQQQVSYAGSADLMAYPAVTPPLALHAPPPQQQPILSYFPDVGAGGGLPDPGLLAPHYDMTGGFEMEFDAGVYQGVGQQQQQQQQQPTTQAATRSALPIRTNRNRRGSTGRRRSGAGLPGSSLSRY